MTISRPEHEKSPSACMPGLPNRNRKALRRNSTRFSSHRRRRTLALCGSDGVFARVSSPRVGLFSGMAVRGDFFEGLDWEWLAGPLPPPLFDVLGHDVRQRALYPDYLQVHGTVFGVLLLLLLTYLNSWTMIYHNANVLCSTPYSGAPLRRRSFRSFWRRARKAKPQSAISRRMALWLVLMLLPRTAVPTCSRRGQIAWTLGGNGWMGKRCAGIRVDVCAGC